MVALTENALSAIRRVMDGADHAAGLRIMVGAGGCSGYQYQLGLVADGERGDAVLDFEGLKVFIDPESQPLLAGTKVDFVEDINGSGFVFDNPNAKDACSCGKSFG